MNRARHHIIHKQVIEVDIPKGRSVPAVQDKIRQTFYDRILPGLDNIFSSLVDDDVIIRIDNLYVDLGQINEAMLEQQLTARALEAVREVLEEKLRFEVGTSDGVHVVPAGKADAEVFLYFLINGRLPWWSAVKDLHRIEASITGRERLPEGFSARFLAAIGDPSVMRRLRLQFSPSFLRFLAAGCIPQFEQSGYAAADPADVLTAFVRGGWGHSSREAAVAETPVSADGKSSPDEVREFNARDGQDAGMEEPGRAADGKADNAGERKADAGSTNVDGQSPLASAASAATDSASARPSAAGPPPGDLRPGGANIVRPVAAEEGSTAAGNGLNGNIASGGTPAESQPGRPPSVSGDERTPDKTAREKEADDEAIYPELAGLVLLHPFVMPFFEALGLTEGRAFRDETCLHKGVHLLGYLATGETEIQEQRLILPKLLCGMDLTEPVERTGIIMEADVAEAEDLLATVISHWKALKNASRAALREMFLQREGKLSPLENGWQLDVEKKTVDILMGSLPWGMSVVKYPWMKGLLFVRWG